MTRALPLTVVALALALASAPRPARAGWRPVVTMLVDTGQGGAPGKQCVADLAAKLKEAGEDIELAQRSLTAIRARLPDALPPSILAWQFTDTAPLRTRPHGDPFDAVIVIDCRPTAHSIDVMVAPTIAATTTLRLRGVAVTPATIAWLAARVSRASFHGFEP